MFGLSTVSGIFHMVSYSLLPCPGRISHLIGYINIWEVEEAGTILTLKKILPFGLGSKSYRL